ncbi:TetR/AcrR family transcriptional regulator [Acidovorax sp. NCPPB 3859]|nr:MULTISPECIES: TetR/AcrR family transcriptional regulator [unclassified Acidovorax]MDA8451750.1 TetR/AcrR family transcriptional regulator [Acidovorax sp. GBBC 3297]MDA8461223.1 TetR/AcrR family transcriptional regulator [Acidovorax sp. GBBC 3333]MDA8466256.1 TetR/AcrR family transcriptional regulator [Acidovorax sp. GBBC 3332]MDA8471264.1 TetR/AcrR family transcriptional regulator [Acidovorax sp. GBBC 3299]WCM76623.1 TetR/AcrR family transcriptional regulator [Acidovorax sp. GBBC 712]
MARPGNSHSPAAHRPLPQPRKAPRQARSQAMVEAILEATARVLAERGYAGTNTNLVAERAGVSIGSVYQYFPNKDSLVTALHERHGAQMYTAIADVLAAERPDGLRGHVQAMVRALLAAHRVAPDLHRVLEKEFPFFDAPREESAADGGIFRQVRALLESHRGEIAPADLDLATWMVLQTMESLVHAAAIDPPAMFPPEAVEAAIVQVLMGYLTAAPVQG